MWYPDRLTSYDPFVAERTSKHQQHTKKKHRKHLIDILIDLERRLKKRRRKKER